MSGPPAAGPAGPRPAGPRPDGPRPDGADTGERLTAELEGILLGGSARYTRRELADRSGVPLAEGRRLWRALGFADVGDDDAVFTDADLRALCAATDLLREGLLDDRSRVALTRALGQSMARLAEAVLEQFEAVLAGPDVGAGGAAGPPDAPVAGPPGAPGAAPREPRAGPVAEVDPERIVRLTRDAVPKVQELLVYVWRRQLTAAAARRLTGGSDVGRHPLVVCFADLSGFTGITRQLSDGELAELVERFEGLAGDVVAASGGRVVKTVGDEVLFVVGQPAAAAEAALRLVTEVDRDPVLPPVRAGLAYGTVLTRVGDVYGVVVNLAARLTSVARSGSVLVDRALADALAGDPRYLLHRTPRFAVRGFPHLQPTRLRWADDRAGAEGAKGAAGAADPAAATGD